MATPSLLKSGDLQGLHLIGLKGAKLGTVREAFINAATGQTEFLIVDTGGLLGGSGKFHPIPWASTQYDGLENVFRVEISKEDFKTAPSYDREQLASESYGWNEQATRHFAPPHKTTIAG